MRKKPHFPSCKFGEKGDGRKDRIGGYMEIEIEMGIEMEVERIGEKTR